MPCTELADAIVSSGRDTLLRAISLVNSHPAWGAKVVYGDTDSLFVHLPGRTRQEAFRIGKEMEAAVTAANPRPVKLQLEKARGLHVAHARACVVGHACVALTRAPASTGVPPVRAGGQEALRGHVMGVAHGGVADV